MYTINVQISFLFFFCINILITDNETIAASKLLQFGKLRRLDRVFFAIMFVKQSKIPKNDIS